MLGHIDKNTNVLQTVVPIDEELFELPVQQLAGICGFWTYYMYTGDREFLEKVYDASLNYVNIWTFDENGLAVHREGSWDWMDWGKHADTTAIENAWYYYALSNIRNMAEVLGKSTDGLTAKMNSIKQGYESLWTEDGYKSEDVSKPDDRANALAVISGLADKEKYGKISEVLTEVTNASPYMEYYVLEALCQMDRYDLAKSRMLERYGDMIDKDYSTLWERWSEFGGTQNHAWSGGPLVIMSKYFAGVRPTKPGYSEFVIKPQMAESDTVKCVVPSVKGYIKVTQTKSGNSFSLDAEIPKDTTALVYLPYQDGQTVTLNGNTVYKDGQFAGTDGIGLVDAADGFCVISLKNAENTSVHFKVN